MGRRGAARWRPPDSSPPSRAFGLRPAGRRAVPCLAVRPCSWTGIRRARQTPFKPLLERLGYRLNAIANDNYVVIGLPREIVVKGHCWACADGGDAGNAIDFPVRVNAPRSTKPCGCSRRDTGTHA